MKIYLVKTRSCDDGCLETVATFSTREAADEVALRGGWCVEEMGMDVPHPDQWWCQVGVDGDVTRGKRGPASELDKAYLWSSHAFKKSRVLGSMGFGWTPEEAEEAARKILEASRVLEDEEVSR